MRNADVRGAVIQFDMTKNILKFIFIFIFIPIIVVGIAVYIGYCCYTIGRSVGCAIELLATQQEAEISNLKSLPTPADEKMTEEVSVGSQTKMGGLAFEIIKNATTTAYCLNSQPMASGKMPYRGAVANNQYPFGTKVEIDDKIYVVEDRIGWGTDWDIWFRDCDLAIAFGIKRAEVKIVTTPHD